MTGKRARRESNKGENVIVLPLEVALERLASGDHGVRLPVGAHAPPGAEAFNRVAELAARGAAEAAAPSLLDPALIAGMTGQGGEAFVAIVGVDRFGELRRQMGSAIAAEILARLCARLREWVPGMRLGRVGRTLVEFVFPAEDEAAARRIMDKARAALERRLQLKGESFDLDVAIGFARCGDAGEAAIDKAAVALAHAQSGHARIAMFTDEEREEAVARLELLRDFHHALAGGRLFVAYQPKLAARSGLIEAVEALVRWPCPRRGLVPPTRFIPLAEETGAILDMTRWVVGQAVADRRALEARGRRLSIHVNLSGRLVADAAFADWLLAAIGGLEPGAIGLEITETAVIEDPAKALANLQAFADAGVPIAIDDYGSGLSSLAYLKQLPARELKIDKLFISSLASSHRDPLIVRSTIDLAHALGMVVTAEGVETPEAFALLRAMGCDLIQGYVISPAVPLHELEALLAAGVQIDQPSVLPAALRRAGA